MASYGYLFPTRRDIVIVYGQEIVNFASLYLKCPFQDAKGIGFIENERFLGGVIFDTFKCTADGALQSCEASVIVIDKRWVTSYNLKKIYELPFIQLGVKRLQIRCGRNEKKKRLLIERMGFHYEGILREAWTFGGDARCYSMLRHECIWL